MGLLSLVSKIKTAREPQRAESAENDDSAKSTRALEPNVAIDEKSSAEAPQQEPIVANGDIVEPTARKNKGFKSITRKEWKVIGFKLARSYLLLFVMWLGLLSIYWGLLYLRQNRVANMKILVVIEDQIFTTSNGTVLAPVIGPTFVELLNEFDTSGLYEIIYGIDLDDYRRSNSSIYHTIQKAVYEQRVWAGFYINKTALQIAYNLIGGSNSTLNNTLELQYIINCVYEQGRLYSALSQYLSKNINWLSLAWIENYAPQAYAELLTTAFTSSEQQQIIQQVNSTLIPAGLTYFPAFNTKDLHLSPSSVVLGPSELGLVYALIFSFHQFNFAADLHTSLISQLHFTDLLVYRFFFAQLNHMILSLVYSLMTIAFQVPINLAYGRAGFMVLWMTMYMFFSATGGTMEVAGTFIRYSGRPYLVSPILIFLIVINISCTFGALVLSPGIYRYGYALPMFNTYEALKVVFFNTWRGTLGRNYGVLAAWIVANCTSLALLLHYIRKYPREDKPLISSKP